MMCAFTFFTSCERNDLFFLASKSELKSVSITPGNTLVSPAESVRFEAHAVYSDDSVKDVTSEAEWGVSGDCTLDGKGTVTSGAAGGTFSIRASFNGTSGESNAQIASANTYFVSISTGSDATGTGSSRNPYQTISYAVSAHPGCTINIAGGTYPVSAGITISSAGTSLIGGYSAADWIQDIPNNPTIITDTRTTGGLATTPIATITASSVTATTKIIGLAIVGPVTSGGGSAGIYLLSASPLIQQCQIYGGKGFTINYGIFSSSSSPVIIACRIYGSNESAAASSSAAVYTYGSGGTAIILNSLLYGRNGTTSNTGLYVTAASSTVYCYNNIIIGLSSSSGYSSGININAVATCYIRNNTIYALYTASTGTSLAYALNFSSSGGSFYIENNILRAYSSVYYSYCVFHNTTANPIIQLQNNLCYSAGTPAYTYYRLTAGGFDFAGFTATIIPYLTGAGSTVAGNLFADPQFVSADNLHVQSTSAARNNGLNGYVLGWTNFPNSAGIPYDAEFKPRPTSVSWTIGAYEYQ